MLIKESWKKNSLVNKEEYEKMYNESIKNNDEFWNKQGNRLDWIKKYTKIKNVKYGSSDVSIKQNIENINKDKEFWKVLVLLSLLFITIEILLIKTIKT